MAAVNTKVTRRAEALAVGALAVTRAVHRAGLGVLAGLATETRIAVAVARGVVALAAAIAASLARHSGEAGQSGVATSAREATVTVAEAVAAFAIAVAVIGALCLGAVNTLETFQALAHPLLAHTMTGAVSGACLVLRAVHSSIARVAEALPVLANAVVRAILWAQHLLRTCLALVAWLAIALAIGALAVVVAHLAGLRTGARRRRHAVLTGKARVTVALSMLAHAVVTAIAGAFALL